MLSEVDSPDRIPEPFAIMAESVFVEVPFEFEPHAHALHELVWVQGGTMTTWLDDRVVTVPDGYGLWLPARTVHSGRMTARTALCDAYFEPTRTPVAFTESTVVEITPVLAALLTHLERDDLAEAARLRAEGVVFDLLASAEHQYTLQIPRAEHITPIVAALLEDPTDARTLGEWAEVVGVSERTIARLFRAQTGLSFLQWRQVLRVHLSLTLISEGLEVQEVSEQLGYAQSSTFIASFKRVMGMTPGAYANTRRRG